MELELRREEWTDESTIGVLFVDEAEECFTLEDKDRYLEDGEEKKVPGKTAIPRGTYKVVIDKSIRWNKLMPHILTVPGFEGIRIHSGNKAVDTEGCILVGTTREKDFVGNSKVAYTSLFNKLKLTFNKGEEISLEVA